MGGGVRAAQREDFQRGEGPTQGARGKEGSNKQPLPEIRGCQRGRGCDVVDGGWWCFSTHTWSQSYDWTSV